MTREWWTVRTLLVVVTMGCGGRSSAPAVGGGSRDGAAAGPDGGGDSKGPSGADVGQTAPPTTWAEACAASARLGCERMAECGPFVFRYNYGDQAYCQVRRMEFCLQQNDLPSTTFTPASMISCTAALKALTCNDWYAAVTWELHVPAACRPGKGTAAAGASCALDKQCQSGFCQVPDGATCGICMDQIALGKPCTSIDRCADEGHCDFANTCAAPLVAGEQCAENIDCSGEDLYCVAGKCMALRKTGEACPNDDYCDAFLTCLNGKCALAGRVGDACSANANGDSCSWSQGGFCAPDNKCVATQLAMSGQPCDPSKGIECDRDSMCDSSFGGPGNCVNLLPLGAQCTPDGVPCRIVADCVNGACAVRALKACK